MATLNSPGVLVTVTDNTTNGASAANSVPLVILATAQNKADPTGSTSVAVGTTATNAGVLQNITSQSQLLSTYGNPFFYTGSDGTPIPGYELNEYGLLAAYSALGITDSIYTLRANIDLASLVGSTGRPSANPANGTYWLNTTSSTWGINQFNSATGTFTAQSPIVITSATQLSSGLPLQSLGNIGQYAVNAIPTYSYPSAANTGQFFYKNSTNTWVQVGTAAWLNSWPTVQGTATPATLTVANTLSISISGAPTIIITVPASPNNTVANLATQINSLGYGYLSASVVSGKLNLFSAQTAGTSDTARYLTISGTGTILNDIGITAGSYYQPYFYYGTTANQPLWQTGQSAPRPTGSVWIKVGSSTACMQSVISQWNSTTASWVAQAYNYSTSDWGMISSLDSTGGMSIPAGTLYTQYDYDNTTSTTGYKRSPTYYWERAVAGPTVATGSITAPVFNTGPFPLTVQVSIPGQSGLGTYSMTIPNNATATSFCTVWNTTAIPYTSASVTSSGAIQLTHTAGGVIILNDFNTSGVSSGLIADAGFIIGSTNYVKEGPAVITTFTPAQTSTTGVGTGLVLNVTNSYQTYYANPTTFVSAGTGYNIGDTVTISGTALGGASPANNLVVKVVAVNTVASNAVTEVAFVSGTGASAYTTQISNWVEVNITASSGAPVAQPAANTNWYYSDPSQIDIMVNTTTGWKGYGNVNYDSNGFPLPSGTNSTDPNGPIISATAPTTQFSGTALAYGDIWIDTSDLDNFPVINRWQSVNGVGTWVLINNTDNTDSSGVLFADARWATSGSIDPVTDAIPTIQSLLLSNYLDLDAPNTSLYPVGMLLFNTRRSGYNVKQFMPNYFNSVSFPGQSLPTYTNAWVSVSGADAKGNPYMGRKAQRAMVVQALEAVIQTNSAIQDLENFFNLIVCPGYPELQSAMITLNTDRNDTAFIIGDTPMRLQNTATALANWATNVAGAAATGEAGLVTRDTNLGLFYPSGMTTDLSGNNVVVPASHMMLYTFLNNDNIAYPWFAAAGTNRGMILNAESIGYINSVTGKYVTITNSAQGIRDVLYENQINPLVFFNSNGLLCYGNKSSFESNTASDRINVARLAIYLRRQLDISTRQFVFEQNDSITRAALAGVIETLLVNLVATRAISDYIVVCDTSNNTPSVIDSDELVAAVGIVPIRSAEVIYIPVVLQNTLSTTNK